MKALDTNVLVRLFINDNEAQASQAQRAFEQGPVFIPITVIQELEWVLRYSYQFDPSAIVAGLRGLIAHSSAYVQDADKVLIALEWHESGLDFSDALHLALSQQADMMLKFDQRFIKCSPLDSECKVAPPSS